MANNILGDAATGASIGSAFAPGIGTAIGAGAGLALDGAEYLINRNAAKKDEASRPKFTIPPEVAQGLSESERQALQGLPEEQKQQYLTNLQRSAAFSLSQNATRKGGLSNIAAINENLNQGYGNLLSADAQARQAKQQQVYNQLQNVADYRGQAFQLNQENPFYEKVYNNRANRGALYQNVANFGQLGFQAGMSNRSAPQQLNTQQPAYNTINTGQANPFALPQTNNPSPYAPFAPGQGPIVNPFGQ